jgi:type 1 glutamine amidotransferase
MKLRLFAATFIALAGTAPAQDGGKKKIVFVAGGPSHGYGDHEHLGGCMLLAKALNESGLAVEAVVTKDNGWPKDPAVFEGAAAVVMYSDGGGGHMVNRNLAAVDALAKKGAGVGAIHYAVETVKGEPGDRFLAWMGGYFEVNWSVNPHWDADFTKLPEHAVTRGVKPFKTNDEWYYHMRFREGMKGVTPILTAVPPDKTRQGKDGSHSGNPAVRAEIGKNTPEHVMWVSENEGGGRGFGFTGGHRHWNWKNDDQRKVMLNAIVWIARLEVPADGVASRTPTQEEMEANLKPKPARK